MKLLVLLALAIAALAQFQMRATGFAPQKLDPNRPCHETLNIDRNSDAKTVQRAFKRYARIYHPDKNIISPTRDQDWLVLDKARTDCLKKRWERVVFDSDQQQQQHSSHSHTFSFNNGKFETNNISPETVAVFLADLLRSLASSSSNSAMSDGDREVWKKATRDFVDRVSPVYDFWFTSVAAWISVGIAVLSRVAAIYSCSDDDPTPNVPDSRKKNMAPRKRITICCCILAFNMLRLYSFFSLLFQSSTVKHTLETFDLDVADPHDFALLIGSILTAVETGLFVVFQMQDFLEYYSLLLWYASRMNILLNMLLPAPFAILFLDAYFSASETTFSWVSALQNPYIFWAHRATIGVVVASWCCWTMVLCVPHWVSMYQSRVVWNEFQCRDEEEMVRRIKKEAYRKAMLMARQPSHVLVNKRQTEANEMVQGEDEDSKPNVDDTKEGRASESEVPFLQRHSKKKQD
ncbi:hypothetical protein HDU81_006882 [Chytriomyces hyalinus]|nr:hypothetical protein HDU81_006882 [Chytriomyces hyalinus]